MKKRLTVAAAFLFAVTSAWAADPLPRAKPEDVGMSSARLARIAPVINADVEKGRLPGAVLAIARKGKLVYYQAFGYLDKDAGARMTTSSSPNMSLDGSTLCRTHMVLPEMGSMAVTGTPSRSSIRRSS